MKDFLTEEALTGHLGGGKRPPNDKTTFERRRPLWEYIRSVATIMPYQPDASVMGFDVDLDPDRAHAMKGHRGFVEYSKELQDAKVIHFTSGMDQATRWLTYFYAFFSLVISVWIITCGGL